MQSRQKDQGDAEVKTQMPQRDRDSGIAGERDGGIRHPGEKWQAQQRAHGIEYQMLKHVVETEGGAVTFKAVACAEFPQVPKQNAGFLRHKPPRRIDAGPEEAVV